MYKHIAITVFCVAISGCFDNKAPEVSDVNNIVIEGTSYSKTDYLQTFCADKTGDANCTKVSHALSKSATEATQPKGW
ncbi:hypothetical protein [Metapseudomonas otitidis]|uniref:hypothetical protein n=1 Tax=Metapseudomonas otitidis TaxID=319939 RepID=UPI000D1B262A|nr:hypothetical protein [Pseudomonas otitidis]